MRRALLAALAVAASAVSAAALDVPFLAGRVNDNAHLLDSGAAAGLEAKLKGYETRTGRQFAVLTIPSLEGEPLEEYSLKVARTWKLGRAGKDDGILLLVARDDRKVRIEVGYGLEGDLPDARAGRIIRDVMVPRFRGGAYALGISEGAAAVIAAADGTPAARSSASPAAPPGRPIEIGTLVAGMIVLLLAVLMDLDEIPKNGTDVTVYLWVGVIAPLGVSINTGPWAFAAAVAVFLTHMIGFPVGKYLMRSTEWGRKHRTKRKGTHGENALYFGAPGGGGGESGGGFSGGGGSFGGGGASGSW